MDNLTRIAVHEAGHVVTALALGYRVTSARASSKGGIVHGDEPADWQHQVLLDLAGLASEESLLGEATPEPSHEDIMAAERHNATYGNRDSFRRLKSQSIQLSWQHQDEIIALANILAERERLSQNDIARLCHSGPLKAFAHLYPAPQKQLHLEPSGNPALDRFEKLFDRWLDTLTPHSQRRHTKGEAPAATVYSSAGIFG